MSSAAIFDPGVLPAGLLCGSKSGAFGAWAGPSLLIRDRDVAAEIIGVNIFKYKLLAFAVSSFYAGVAGALWTYYLRIANYENFTLATSIEYLTMIIIGGLGSVLGSVLGRSSSNSSPLRWI